MDDASKNHGTIVFAFAKLLLASYLITGVLLLILSLLLYRYHISERIVNIGITLTYCLSTFLTGFLAGKSRKKRKFLWGLVLGAAYFVILCLISFTVKGSVKLICGDFLSTFILCMGSGMLGGMIS
ncbi:MAG: TIGR04086 family membrane protein [Lachnospiraceae bacterium]|nr:TIGR04086 family membrane protein [Lachnospiraceae bacterium]